METRTDRIFIWICGASASGKGTLLDKIRDKEKKSSPGRAPICGQVSFIDLSLGHGTGDILNAGGDTIFIKWQRRESHCIEEIKRKMPGSKHRVIFLNPPLDKHTIYFYKKYADSLWLKQRLKLARPLTRKESDQECVRDRKSNLNWLHKECPVEYEIMDPLSIV